MTDKEQIIIDGVDVSKCVHLDRYFLLNNNKEFKDCALSELYYKEFEHSCKDNPNCYYKQLARKTQECEEQENKIKKLRKNLALEIELINRYRNALKEIERICLEDTHTFADETEIRYDSLDDILSIINKLIGG